MSFSSSFTRSSNTKSPNALTATTFTTKNSFATARRTVWPYQLYCSGSYFGDFEILCEQLSKSSAKGHPDSFGQLRHYTVQCQSPTGTLLVIGRQDILRLVADFPHYGAAWRAAGQQKEHRRKLTLQRFTRGMTYRHLAAMTIGRHVRRLLLHGTLSQDGGGPCSVLGNGLLGKAQAAARAEVGADEEVVSVQQQRMYARLESKIDLLDIGLRGELRETVAELRALVHAATATITAQNGRAGTPPRIDAFDMHDMESSPVTTGNGA